MDKIKLKRNLTKLAKAAGDLLFGLLCFVLTGALLLALAKTESPLFYCAMAVNSPGSIIESLSAQTEETVPSLSTDPETEEEAGAQFEEETSSKPESQKDSPAEGAYEVQENRRGKVTEITYSPKEGGIYIKSGNAIIKNCTKHSAKEVREMLKTDHKLSLSTDLGLAPQVLIYHTHATEGFEPVDRGYFDLSSTWRSTDNTENMTTVGDVMETVLKQKGIGVIHNKTLHDDPSYNGSYERSAVTVKEILAQNPDIKIALDLHRDAIEPSETEIIKPTAVINGKKAAQIMIIAGCDNGKFNMPNYPENLRFAAALADKMEEMYPGLCRAVLFDYRKYNMNLSPGLLLIEIGATGNTLEEAKYSAELLANALYALLAE